MIEAVLTSEQSTYARDDIIVFDSVNPRQCEQLLAAPALTFADLPFKLVALSDVLAAGTPWAATISAFLKAHPEDPAKLTAKESIVYSASIAASHDLLSQHVGRMRLRRQLP